MLRSWDTIQIQVQSRTYWIRVHLAQDTLEPQGLVSVENNHHEMLLLVAMVTVAFPATPLLLSRARICMSASHTKEDLLRALEVISSVGDLVGIKYFPAEPNKLQEEEGMIKED